MRHVIPFIFLLSVGLSTMAQSGDSSRYFLRKGMEEKDSGQLSEALRDFQQSIRYDPNNINALRETGMLATALNQYELAKSAYRKLLLLRKNDTTAVRDLPNLYLQTQEWLGAIRYASTAIQLHVGRNNYYVMGKSYYEISAFEHALGYLPAAQRDDPQNPEIPYLLAKTFEGLNSYRAAIPYFQKAISMDSTNTGWIYECAQAFSSAFDDKSAVQYYELAAQKGLPKDSTFYENLANSYIASGQTVKGLRILQDQADRKPGDMKILARLAYTNYQVKKYDEAISAWSKILSYDKQNARAMYMMGLAYQKKGDIQKGKTYCDQALALEPAIKDSLDRGSTDK
ncbi:MAG TPA: tetratricopeptide repeat protein [Puia sp.]|nr:tetratricopeptide repeat protein [Puia sp.]